MFSVSFGWRVLLECLVITFLFYCSLQLFTNEKVNDIPIDCGSSVVESVGPNPLDGCLHVYLDMGTNTGVQLRKLYESQLFSDAPVIPVFEKFFGKNKKDVCTVGFEPHPSFSPGLKNLESHYQACGLNVKVYTQTAVTGNSNGEKATFQQGASELDGRLIDGTANFTEPLMYRIINSVLTFSQAPEGVTYDVETLRISDYINNIVATRKLPLIGTEIPRVVMKLDVEGAELEILPDLVMNGALRHIDLIMVDFHTWWFQNWADTDEIAKLRDSLKIINGIARKQGLLHVAEISELDDETYGNFDGKYTSCEDILKL